MEQFSCYFNSPIGYLEIIANESAVTSVEFMKEDSSKINHIKNQNIIKKNPVLYNCVWQLDEYFRGERRDFSLKLELVGTDFQRRVWDQLIKIRYGETISYLEQAIRIGNEKASRAVGCANGKNRISIIIPCHRVIGKDGKLVGFGAGIWRKRWLLNHERKVLNTER